MPKDTQLLNREKWLEEISSWEIQSVQGITDLNFTEQEINEIYAPIIQKLFCLLYTSPSPRDVEESRMPSSA